MQHTAAHKPLTLSPILMQMISAASLSPVPLDAIMAQVPIAQLDTENDLSRLIPRLTLKVHSHLEECQELWEMFTPKESLFDLWEYRHAWIKGYGYKCYFYTLYEGKKVLGALPMWYNEQEQKYEWIGGYWMEGNSFFAVDDSVIDLMLSIVPLPVELMSIKPDQAQRSQFRTHFEIEEDLKYTKDIAGMSTMADVVATYKKKHRYNLKRDYNRMVSMGAQTEIIDCRDGDFFDEIRNMKKMRYDGKKLDLSVFEDAKQEAAFHYAIAQMNGYGAKFYRTTIGGNLAAVDLILTHGNTCYQMTGANDVEHFSGIGNYMAYVEIEDAIRCGYGVVDCLQEDHSWKHRYFDGREMCVFVKN